MTSSPARPATGDSLVAERTEAGGVRETVARAAAACPTELAMEVVGGKWKLVIVERLVGGARRFGELQRALPGITARMLTRQLRELETDGLVTRTVHAEVPPRVEYALTTRGAGLAPLIADLRRWGEDYARAMS